VVKNNDFLVGITLRHPRTQTSLNLELLKFTYKT